MEKDKESDTLKEFIKRFKDNFKTSKKEDIKIFFISSFVKM